MFDSSSDEFLRLWFILFRLDDSALKFGEYKRGELETGEFCDEHELVLDAEDMHFKCSLVWYS